MRRAFFLFVLLFFAISLHAGDGGKYLFVWAGDAATKARDFLGVIDADPASAHYGAIVASLPVDAVGSHPHHTELETPAGGHLLANGFVAGRTWLFDISSPLQPRVLAEFGDVAGFSHPHTFIRLPNGHVLATFQYKAGKSEVMGMHHHGGTADLPKIPPDHATGGIVEMDERGRVLRSAAAADPNITDTQIFPYSVLPLPAMDRMVSTTTDMDDANTKATAQWVQLWRMRDFKLLRSIALPPGPHGEEQKLTGEPKLLPDGKSVYVHTFDCGLYLLRGVEGDHPEARFVYGFPFSEGFWCGVPVLTGHFWLQPVPALHALVALDVSDPERPREVSRVEVNADEKPHWLAMDTSGKRLVMNSGGGGGNRLFIINFDSQTGKLTLDEKFRDRGSASPGVSMDAQTWPHGFTGKVIPHGSLFSR